MISTVIFDLDGLLADTEKLHRQAYRQALGEFGVGVSDRHYEAHWIRDGKGIVDFIAELGLDLAPDAVRVRKAVHYERLVRDGAEAMPGALEVLDALHGRWPLALATSSYPESAFPVMETLGIQKYFACIATKSSVARVKPFPDIFLWVATHLNVQPETCVVVEDAEKGIRAAYAAGMPSVAIPNEHTRNNDFSLATLVLPSLNALRPDMIDELGRG